MNVSLVGADDAVLLHAQSGIEGDTGCRADIVRPGPAFRADIVTDSL
jgi:hypothetical protein